MDSVLIVAVILLVVLAGILLVLRMGSRAEEGPSRSPGRRQPGGGARRGGRKRNWLVGESVNIRQKGFHIGSRTVTIGRGVSNFVQITDEDVSRVHAQLIPSPNGLQIKDMESNNGTYVNNEPIKVHILKDGDIVRMGKTSFRYHAEGDFVDHGLQGGKAVDQRAHRSTQLGTQESLKDMLSSALKVAEGDVSIAATNLGMDEERLLVALKAQNLNPDDFTA